MAKLLMTFFFLISFTPKASPIPTSKSQLVDVSVEAMAKDLQAHKGKIYELLTECFKTASADDRAFLKEQVDENASKSFNLSEVGYSKTKLFFLMGKIRYEINFEKLRDRRIQVNNKWLNFPFDLPLRQAAAEIVKLLPNGRSSAVDLLVPPAHATPLLLVIAGVIAGIVKLVDFADQAFNLEDAESKIRVLKNECIKLEERKGQYYVSSDPVQEAITQINNLEIHGCNSTAMHWRDKLSPGAAQQRLRRAHGSTIVDKVKNFDGRTTLDGLCSDLKDLRECITNLSTEGKYEDKFLLSYTIEKISEIKTLSWFTPRIPEATSGDEVQKQEATK